LEAEILLSLPQMTLEVKLFATRNSLTTQNCGPLLISTSNYAGQGQGQYIRAHTYHFFLM
jgi:hypothetical protein